MYNPTRFWIEAAAAIVSAAVFLITLVEPRWFEMLFDDAPDDGDGSLEGWIALTCSLVASILFARLASVEWRRRSATHLSA
jgi:hypothetical protein